MTTYHLALDPDVGVPADAFVAAWNAEYRGVAEAQLAPESSAAFDPLLAAFGLVVLSTLASAVAGNAFYDLIKELLIKEGVRKRTEIRMLEQPDGSRLIVITVEET